MDYFQIEGPRVSRDAALELMVHHLQMAHACFQNTIHDVDAKREEAHRLFTEGHTTIKRWVDDGGIGSTEIIKVYTDSPEVVAGMEWLTKMEEIYETMRHEQED